MNDFFYSFCSSKEHKNKEREDQFNISLDGNMNSNGRGEGMSLSFKVAGILEFIAILIISIGGINASAQEFDFSSLPVLDVNPDFNGVDPASGSFSTTSPLTLSAPGAGHLKLRSSFNGRRQTFSLNIYLLDKTYTPGYATSPIERRRHIKVHVGGRDKLFTCGNVGDCTQVVSSDGSQLTRVTTDNYVYTDKFGTAFTFYPLNYHSLTPCNDLDGEDGCNAAEYEAFAYISTIVYASGEKLTYEPYSTVVTEGGQTYARDTIRSNLGYKIVFEETVSSGYTASTTAGSNWFLYHIGTAPPRISLFRDTQLIDTLVTTENRNSGTNTLTWTQRDDLHREYRVTFKGGTVWRCSPGPGIQDNTPLLPVIEVSPGGVTTNIEYHKNSSGSYQQAKGVGTSIPVKTITRGGKTWTYDNVADSRTITDPYGETRTADHTWLNDGYDYGLYGTYCPSGYVSTNITAYQDELNRQSDYSYIGELLDVGHLPEDNGYDYDYDTRGNLTGITQLAKPDSSLSNRVVFEAEYPETCSNPKTCNKPKWVKDAKRNITDYTYYPSHGGVWTVTKPAQPNGVRPVTTYSYEEVDTGDGTIWRKNRSSMCTEGTDCLGADKEQVTVTTYWNNTFLPETVTIKAGNDSVSATESFEYDNAGRKVKATDSLGHATHYFYDVIGRNIGEISEDPDGEGPLPRIARRTTYNNGSQPTLLEAGMATGITRSALNEMVVTSHIDIDYDDLGRKDRETKVSGAGLNSEIYSITQYSYDAWNRLVCTAERMSFLSVPNDACQLGAMGEFGYDRITKNEYDDAGQLVKVYKAYGTPLQQVYTEYEYSDNGKKTFITDANGNKAKLSYDGYDRQTHWYFPSKSKGSLTYSNTDYEKYGYDLNDNRTSYRKRDGTVLTYGYDNLNRMAWKKVPSRSGLSSSHTQDVYYGYDNRGLTLYTRFGSETGEGVTQSYDALGYMTSSMIDMDGVSRKLMHHRKENGLRDYIVHPDGKVFHYRYDDLDRLSKIYHADAGDLANYGYDEKGDLFYLDGGIYSDYDSGDFGRLKNLRHDLVDSSSDITYEYQYNPASQITRVNISSDRFSPLPTPKNESYQVNGLNQYSEVSGVEHDYDDNGNLISDGQTVYAYDQENRLVKATDSDGSLKAELWYDPLGRLYKMQGSSGVTHFLYDGDELVAEFDNTSTTVKERYIHGAAQDDPVAWFEGASVTPDTKRHLRANHQGSIVAVSSRGSSLFFPRYDNWGQPESIHPVRFGYTGQAWVDELGLWFYKARLYSPALGRFLQTDPVGYEDQMNLYAYVRNDPLNNFDPSGMATSLVVNAVRIGTRAYKYRNIGGAVRRIGNDISYDWNQLGSESTATAGEKLGSAADLILGTAFNESSDGGDERTADDPLPRDKNGNPVPESDAPHTQLGTKSGRSGDYKQGREFGENGEHVKDIDFTDHGRSDHENPHEHPMEPNETGGTPRRGPPRPLNGG